MRLFDWFRTAPRQEAPPSVDAERLAAMERDLKMIRLEWEETYEKVHTTLRKLAKRAERAAGSPCANCGPGEDPEAIPGGAGVDWRNPQVKARALAAIRARNGRH